MDGHLSHDAAAARGLGLFTSPSSQAFSTMMGSPEPESWALAPTLEADGHVSPSPDLFSAAIDPFFSAAAASSTVIHATTPSPDAPALDFCHTPPSSDVPSHRGSVSSSYAPSEVSEYAYTPRARTEDGGEWYAPASGDQVLQRSCGPSMAYGPVSAPLAVPHHDTFFRPTPEPEDPYRSAASASGEWTPKHAANTYVTDLSAVHAHAYAATAAAEGRLPRFNVPMLSGGSMRVKKKRQRTTPEEATHNCRICGKLFKRSYNWKSHMDTHNPERKYPHPCTAMIGDTPCTKRFQRKTDLDRHHDSVHLKARNHQCNLCGNSFARRDTLRRHTEDGCPKRFNLGLRDASSLNPNPSSANLTQAAPASAHQRWMFPSPAPTSAVSTPYIAAATPSPVPPFAQPVMRARSVSVGVPAASPYPVYANAVGQLPSPSFA